MASKKKRSTGKQAAKAPKQPTVPSAATTPASGTSAREKRQKAKEHAKEVAAARQAAARKKARLTNGVIIGAAAVLVLGLVYWVWSESNPTVNKPAAMSADYGLVVGQDSAAQKVVIYEDFLCPGCGDLESAISDKVTSGTEGGAASVEYRPVNWLGTDYSNNAAQAFWAVLEQKGPEVARTFHDALFAAQPSEGGDLPGESWIADQAGEAGADRDAVLKALKDDTYEGLVKKATSNARAHGLRSTPTVYFNGERSTATTLGDQISQVVGVLGASK